MSPIFYTSDGRDETYVYDQHCDNCRFWGPDMETGKMKCKNGRSERRYQETRGDGWCWCWTKVRGRSKSSPTGHIGQRAGDDYGYEYVDG